MTTKETRTDPLGFLADEIEELKRQNLYRPMRVLSSPQAAEVVVDGKELISLSSNNYLGLATHPKLKEAAIAATRDFGTGSGRGADDRRQHDDPRAPRDRAGRVQAHRGGAHLPVGLHRQLRA